MKRPGGPGLIPLMHCFIRYRTEVGLIVRRLVVCSSWIMTFRSIVMYRF